jgi:catechol 2,3-dioxygenase-like lactoylglutathione lyase family enzyme
MPESKPRPDGAITEVESMPTRSTNFNLKGFNHVALTCADMQDTVDFYEGILGFPLIKTLDLAGHGQHFFFQVTEDDGIAFFYFNNMNPPAPGIAAADWNAGEMTPNSARGLTGKAAPGAMHHLSFGVPADKLQEYRQKLMDAGIEVSDIIRQADENGEFIDSFFFKDPDGVVLEFSAYTEAMPNSELSFAPARAEEAAARRRAGVPHTV